MLHNAEKAFENFEFKAKQKGIEKVAQRMLGIGMEIAFIAEVTGFTELEIENIRKLGSTIDTLSK